MKSKKKKIRKLNDDENIAACLSVSVGVCLCLYVWSCECVLILGVYVVVQDIGKKCTTNPNLLHCRLNR